MNVQYKKKILLFSLLLFSMQATVKSQVISQGPLNPGTVQEQFAGCLSCQGASWFFPLNAMLPDSMFAQTQLYAYPACFMSNCYFARALMATGFSFSIPPTSTIVGIKTEVLRKASVINSVIDTIVQLLKNGTPSGTNKAASNYWTLTGIYQVYGDSTDLWGTTWNAADINSTGFGLFFKPMNKSVATAFASAMVDHIRITVYYVTATGIEQQQSEHFSMSYDELSASLLLNFLPLKISPSILKIYDDNGRLIFEKFFAGNLINERVDLSKLKNGFYIAKLSEGDQQTALKFLISGR